MFVVTWILMLLLTGSLVYCIMSVIATRQFLRVRPPRLTRTVPISVLRPLHGLEDGLEENLRSLFRQDYPDFELLFEVDHADDPAVAVLERVRAEFPGGPPVRLIAGGEPPVVSGKAFALQCLVPLAKADLLVTSESDVRVPPDYLRILAAEFEDSRVGVITCPYRGIAGRSVWSRLEALGLNTEFLSGVLVARMVEGMKFALGGTIALRREVLEKIGGYAFLREYLAEDFMLGKRAAELGFGVLLSSCVIDHHMGNRPFLANMRHRLRWTRNTRCSRPQGYWGQLFTYPLPLALLLWAWDARMWPLVLFTLVLRGASAWAADWVLKDPLTKAWWWAVPAEDVLSFILWIGGFFGNSVDFRGRLLRVTPDGRVAADS
jgi:ceramide glucosyltransferase